MIALRTLLALLLFSLPALAQSSGPPSAPAPVLRNYLTGLTLSASSTTVLGIAAGNATDSANVASMNLGAFTKATAGAWASGSGANGMGNGLTIAASTWYHVCLANNGGVADVWFDTSAVCANRPTGIVDSAFRRIGSFKTDASSLILAFSQNGDEFLWASGGSGDVVLSSFGVTTRTAETINVPLGVKVNALISGFGNNAAGSNFSIFSPDLTASTAITVFVFGATNIGFGVLGVRTNASSQVEVANSAVSTSGTFGAVGWIDPRGK